jgi:hypothetical protein
VSPGKRKIAIGIALLSALFAFGCGGGGGEESGAGATQALPQGSEEVDLRPSDFTAEIDNPYWPMRPGSRWTYRESNGEGGVQIDVVTVTDRTRKLANGIEARVVHDVVSQGGHPVEVTDDWYAQDAQGNIWYMGEQTAEYENGKVATREGSWEAGVDGAQPGIALPAEPQQGIAYRQEYYAGQAEDQGEVIATGGQAEVPFGHFTEVVSTQDTSPLEPRVVEYKFYAPGVGPVLTLDVSGESGREELIDFTGGP